MTPFSLRGLALAAIILTAAAPPARAQDADDFVRLEPKPGAPATPQAQADALRAQLAAWLAKLRLAGTVPAPEAAPGPDGTLRARIPASSLEVAPAGSGITSSFGDVTIGAVALRDGSWRFDRIVAASPLEWRSGPADWPDWRVALRFNSYEGAGLLDPAFGQSGEITTWIRGIRADDGTERSPALADIDELYVNNRVSVAPDGRVDNPIELRAGGVAIHGSGSQEGAFAVRAGQLGVSATARGIKRESASTLLPLAQTLLPGLMPLTPPLTPRPDTETQPTDEQRAASLAADLGAILGGMRGIDFTITGTALQIANRSGTQFAADTLRLSLGASGTGQGLDLTVGLHAAALVYPDGLPPKLRTLLPRHAALQVRAAGLPGEEMQRGLTAALREQPGAAQDLSAALKAAPVDWTVETLAFDLGPAEFTGHARIAGPSPAAASVTGELRATNFPALMKQARQVPEAGQALGVLIFLNGLAEADGDATVWRIETQAGRLKINGTDLTDMAPQGNTRPEEQPAPPGQNAP